MHRVLAAGKGERVVWLAARASGEGDHVIGSEQDLLGYIEPEPERPNRHVRIRERPEADLRCVGVAMDVPFFARTRVAGDAKRAAHEYPSLEQPRQGWLAEDRDGQVCQRAERYEGDLAGS